MIVRTFQRTADGNFEEINSEGIISVDLPPIDIPQDEAMEVLLESVSYTFPESELVIVNIGEASSVYH